MTVICAIHEPGVGMWIGSDSRLKLADDAMPSIGQKWFTAGQRAIGISGFSRTKRIIQRAMPALLDEAASPDDVADRIRALVMRDEQIGTPDRADGNGPKCYGCSHILVLSGEIYDIAADFAVTPIMPGAFWARGSGMDYALGAAYALRGMSPEKIVTTAIEAACANNTGCGGPLFIHLLRA